MVVLHQTPTFLLPPTGNNCRPPAYALVILNQCFPRFTPLLWEHQQHNSAFVLMVVQIVSMMKCLSYSLMKIQEMFDSGVIKGDIDSIRTAVLNFYIGLGTKVFDKSHDQDTTDLHKCMKYVRENTEDLDKPNHSFSAWHFLLGGHFDHETGNISFSAIRIILLSDDCLICLLPRTHRHEIHIQHSVECPHCVRLPSDRTTRSGLQWNLVGMEMLFGGLVSTSNIVTEDVVMVESGSDLLWTVSLKRR